MTYLILIVNTTSIIHSCMITTDLTVNRENHIDFHDYKETQPE